MIRSLFHPRIVALALLAILPYALGATISTLLVDFPKVNAVFMPLVRETFTLGLASIAIGFMALILGVIRLALNGRRWWETVNSWQSWWLLHLWTYGLVAAVVVATVMFEALFESTILVGTVYISVYMIAHGLLALVLIYAPKVFSRPPRGLRTVNRLVFTAVVLCLLIEAMMTLHSQFFFTTAYWNKSLASRQFIEQQQLLNYTYLGHKFNTDGFYDEEFFPSDDGDFVVASITGSFGLGVVPLPYNFTSVAERKLQEAFEENPNVRRVGVHNLGIPNAEVHDLLRVHKHVAKPLNPDLTVYLAFLTNDIHVIETDALRHSHLQNWRVYRFIDKLITPYEREEPRIKVDFSLRTSELSKYRLDNGDKEPEVPDYVRDSTKEEPTLSEEDFIRRELQRLVFCQPERDNIQRIYRMYFNALETFRKRVGPGFIMVLAPDEFQVNDALWEKLMSMVDDPSEYDRDYPQKRVVEYCREKGIPYLDLLPLLREAEKEQRTYHLRDTHWNAWGNEIAGEAIADRILEYTGQSVQSDKHRSEGDGS
ncbi:hypothetical protein DPQ33_03060 [Oceanidesulfovibrio indonesiensis]|uniref:AlgX/AlgJ SGNH hydrolase-like domain-containing protein n=1 Tax=Oceanidesulfovibrio indonesiensis TaxID=54767 RepID=A0A7M3MI33_9BACT|nr:hypothetical protein [Oceanidesulfovibrio indonesiensis]TVM19354.1 hypothetical protein DPQ33_03060 [Oceanidesulfovibrio indonesiensis]